MELRTLAGISSQEISECFNEAFSDYAVPLHLSPQQLQNKMINDGVDLSLSAGAFENGRLTGFILNGIGNLQNIKSAYNAGTGVIPEQRGQRLTRQLYEFIIPKLEDREIRQCVLEVITTNKPAIFTYQKVGFDIVRELNCFKGTPKTGKRITSTSIGEILSPNWEKFTSFWEWSPTWQNSKEAIERSWEKLRSITIEKDGSTVGYLIYDPSSGKVNQFAVKKEFRNQGFGTLLFSELTQRLQKEISIINIDYSDLHTLSFLKSIGLKPYINQYEMKMEL